MNRKREWLIEIRLMQDLTQQQVADFAGVDRSTYAQYESGRRNPHVATAKKIATKLKFDWTIFFASNCGIKQQRRKKTA